MHVSQEAEAIRRAEEASRPVEAAAVEEEVVHEDNDWGEC